MVLMCGMQTRGARSLPSKKKENSSVLQKDKSAPNLECV